jgi:uncharacterized protein (TIGR03437 family)
MSLLLGRMVGLACGFTAALAAAPGISAIVNAANYLPPSLPNSGVAQGALFTVFGTGLGPATPVQAESYPLPTTQGIGGTTAQVTVNGAVENCIMFYSSATRLIAILPSPTPVGMGTLTVTYQGASGSATIQVQSANFGTVTLNGAGFGPAVVTDQSYTPITLIHPAHPGDVLTLWGTGMGPISGNETEPPTATQAVNLANETQVLVGNQTATVGYAGRGGGSPGLDQIDFTVPAGASGCRTSIAVAVSGVTGNVTTMAVAPAGQATCGDTYGLLTSANIQAAMTSGSVTMGGIQAYRVGDLADTFLGGIGTYPLNSLIRSLVSDLAPSVGSCAAYEVQGASFVVNDPYAPSTYLDMGAQLTITGPSGSKTIGETAKGDYLGTLATPPATWVAPGSYTLSNDSGGSNIGAFSWDLTLPANVTATNVPSTVNLGQDLTLNWTGGAAFPLVIIFGYAGVPLTPSGSDISFSEFVCTADGSTGQFTIPSAMLNLIPPDGYGTLTSKGLNIQLAGVALSSFTNLPGVTEALFSVYESSGSVAKIQ